jgi:superfamily II DNA or RNA helicase
MADRSTVLDLLAQLTATPVRRDGILDIPFDEYVEDVAWPEVANLFHGFIGRHKRPTLRTVLSDPRFRRWIEVCGRAPVRKKLEAELAIVCRVVEEEAHILIDEPPAPPPPPSSAAASSHASLVALAEEAGVAARLRDPGGVLLQRVPAGPLRNALRNARRATVAELLDTTFDVGSWRMTARERDLLAAEAKAYVMDAVEQRRATVRVEARVAALGHSPGGEGASQLLTAITDALAAIVKPPSYALRLVTVALERAPARLDVRASLVPDRDGRQRTISIALVLEDWRLSPLSAMVRSDAKEGRTTEATRFVLGAASLVLRDPAHPLHPSLLAYLNEPPWERVLARLGSVVASARPQATGGAASVVWMVTADRGVSILPMLCEAVLGGRDVLRAIPLEMMSGDQLEAVSARDEAVARAIWIAPQPHYYPYGQGAVATTAREARQRAFRALTLLAGHDAVRGRGGVGMRVIVGVIGVSLVEEVAGYRFAFDVDGEPLGAPALRADLGADGYLLHVDPASGRVLLAHAGTRRASALLAIASEEAVFPATAAVPLVERVIALADVVPIALPAPLAGEAIEADARPFVRVVRTGAAALAITWLVRPIAGGAAYTPGDGPTQILQQAGGRAVFAERSFEAELLRMDAVRSQLPEPLANGPLANARCEGLENVLAVIATLRASAESGACAVEWPKSLPRVVGAATWSKLRLRVSAQRDWFGLSGAVEVGGVELTLADLLAARRHGERFISVGPDQLVALEDELRSRLEELDAIARPAAKGALTLANAAVPALTELLTSRDQLDAVPAFWSLLARIDAATRSDPRVPRGFTKVLRPYQVDGFRWMSRLAAWGAGACLADEMGLGKTVQTLALLTARSKDGPALVVAPTSVGPNWVAEARRFAPSLNTVLHRGAGRAATLAALGPGDLLVTSYDLVARDAAALSRVTFSTLVLDEAQAIKNGDTARARAARSLSADFRLALTGTPVENRLSELFSLMEFLNPGIFGSEAEFRARYVVPIERDQDASRSAALARAVRPFLLRRRKADVLSELPARTEVLRAIDASPAERKLYEAARRLAVAALTGADEDARFRVLAEIMRLRRLACHPRLDDATSQVPSSKLETFLELVAELRESGHRALVFSQFTGHLALVQEALRARSVPYLYLDGKTPVAQRTSRVAAFQAGEGDLFLISLKAGGTGLNLTGADTVIHLDPWWNPAVEDQATDRAHRIGQTRPVTVIRLIARGTIEETVMALHEDKRKLAESILEGSGASGKLSIAQLGALIRAGSEAAPDELIS